MLGLLGSGLVLLGYWVSPVDLSLRQIMVNRGLGYG